MKEGEQRDRDTEAGGWGGGVRPRGGDTKKGIRQQVNK